MVDRSLRVDADSDALGGELAAVDGEADGAWLRESEPARGRQVPTLDQAVDELRAGDTAGGPPR
jgi:hypothetical protein